MAIRRDDMKVESPEILTVYGRRTYGTYIRRKAKLEWSISRLVHVEKQWTSMLRRILHLQRWFFFSKQSAVKGIHLIETSFPSFPSFPRSENAIYFLSAGLFVDTSILFIRDSIFFYETTEVPMWILLLGARKLTTPPKTSLERTNELKKVLNGYYPFCDFNSNPILKFGFVGWDRTTATFFFLFFFPSLNSARKSCGDEYCERYHGGGQLQAA